MFYIGERAPSSFSQSQRKAIIMLRVKLKASWEGLTTHTLGHTNATDCWYTQRWFTSHIHTQASVMSQGLVECYRCWRCGKGWTTEERSKGHLVKKWLVLCFFPPCFYSITLLVFLWASGTISVSADVYGIIFHWGCVNEWILENSYNNLFC